MNQATKKFNGPLVLLILDGWGISPYQEGNAVALAKKPVFDALWQNYPNCQINTSGKNVGLPDNEKGNSEAGHINLGTGRIALQEKSIINQAIADRTFFTNPAFIKVIKHVQKNKSKLHLLGLISGSQSAHVEMNHLYALLNLFKDNKIKQVFIHLFTDGRDAPQHASLKYIERLQEAFVNEEKIASVCGRFYAMDRNKKWDRTEKVYNLLTKGHGTKVPSAHEAVIQAYNRGETDEFISPTVIVEDGKPVSVIEANDGVIFFNLRSDRARQLAKAFVQKDFCKMNKGCFARGDRLDDLSFVAMTDFGPDLDDISTAFPDEPYKNSLPIVMKSFKQAYVAETEKYAHVTFFFNGGYADPVAGEERILVPSPHVDRYNERPEMSTFEIVDKVIDKLRTRRQLIVVNFASPDMIGHTGDLVAGIKAVEACDKALEKIIAEIKRQDGILLVTADHGNVEEMINIETKEIDTEHSNYPVPFILVSDQYLEVKLTNGILADISPTIIELFGLKKPSEMTGKSLIIKK